MLLPLSPSSGASDDGSTVGEAGALDNGTVVEYVGSTADGIVDNGAEVGRLEGMVVTVFSVDSATGVGTGVLEVGWINFAAGVAEADWLAV